MMTTILRRRFLVACSMLIATGLILAGGLCTETYAQEKVDFIFVVDASGSMSSVISIVSTGLADFSAELVSEGIDAQFGISLIGGTLTPARSTVLPTEHAGSTPPELYQLLSSDSDLTTMNLLSIDSSVPIDAPHLNHSINPEAGLEMIRMVLEVAQMSELSGPASNFDFRPDARRVLILVTDENSDIPFHPENRFGHLEVEPGDIQDPEWEMELIETAAALVTNDVLLFMLVDPTADLVVEQYGDPSRDLSTCDSFLKEWTLDSLQGSPAENSLQARVLSSGGIARVFDLNELGDPDFVESLYDKILGSLQQLGCDFSPCCQVVDGPLPPTAPNDLLVGPGSIPSITEAIQMAADTGINNVTIRVEPGEYYENVLIDLEQFESLLLISTGGPDVTHIMADPVTQQPEGRRLWIYGGEGEFTRTVQIGWATSEDPTDWYGFTIRDGITTLASGPVLPNGEGGGILVGGINDSTDPRVVIRGNKVVNNEGCTNGGGIAALHTRDVEITLNEIQSNVAGAIGGYRGGGIYLEDTESTVISKNTIENNSFLLTTTNNSRQGGGIFVSSDSEDTVICGNIIEDNQASRGAGVYAAVNGPLSFPHRVRIEANMIRDNDAIGLQNPPQQYRGGGIYLQHGDSAGIAEIFNNAIVSNDIDSAIPGLLDGGSGGGLYVDYAFSSTFDRCDLIGNYISNNVARETGGGIYACLESPLPPSPALGPARSYNNTITDNQLNEPSPDSGSGLALAPFASIEGVNCVIDRNVGGSREWIAACPPAILSQPFRASVLSAISGSDCPGISWDLFGPTNSSTASNLDLPPSLPQISSAGSLLIDQGELVSLPILITFDGKPRLQDVLTGGPVLDIGADEYNIDCDLNGVSDVCEHPADCDGDGTLDICEIASGEALDLDQNGIPDECDLLAAEFFIRGDANNNGGLEIADTIFLLTYLFLAGTPPVCDDSADANDDGGVSISDPIYELAYLFTGGPAPPDPGPSCGEDPTADPIECIGDTTCP